MCNVYYDSQDVDIIRIKYDIQIFIDEEKDNIIDYEYLFLIRIIYGNNLLCIDDECLFFVMRLFVNYKFRNKIVEIYLDIKFYKNRLEKYRYIE